VYTLALMMALTANDEHRKTGHQLQMKAMRMDTAYALLSI
jgi:hypothetical protein